MPNGAGGGGGGGIVGVGNSFTGPAQSLEIIGDHAYAYSGNIGASSPGVEEAMKFTTGNYYLVGFFQVNMAIGDAPSSSTSITFGQVEFNGNVISHLAAGLTTTDSQVSVRQPIIIPSYTEVVLKLYSNENQSTRFMTGTLTGRIYRG